MKCIDCQHLSLQDAGEKYARLGMGKCKALDWGKATFVTAAYARECASFELAPAEQVEKRTMYLQRLGQ